MDVVVVVAEVLPVPLLARAVQQKHQHQLPAVIPPQHRGAVVRAVAGQAPRRRNRKRSMLRTRRRP